jgi:uncharacterized protein YjaG (DUF416 family)
LDELIADLGRLDNRKQAAVFAALAERNLPAYEEFTRRLSWGDFGLMRSLVDCCWRALTTGEGCELDDERLSSVVPPGDRFDAPASTYAQATAILVDAAVKASLGNPEPKWLEYALEPVRASTETDLDDELIEHSIVDRECRHIRDLIAYAHQTPAVGVEAIRWLKVWSDSDRPVLTW